MMDATPQQDTRSRIIEAAATLLRDGGPPAVTTRGVAQSAGVQAPAIYRLFGDKDGLLEAVAEHVLAEWVATKALIVATAEAEGLDPVDDLRAGWSAQVEFGMKNPALFRLLSDPTRATGSAAASSGKRVLESRIHRVAEAGRLRVPEKRAVGLFQTAGVGVVTTLLAAPAAERDPGLAEAALDAVLAQILTDRPAVAHDGPLAAVVAVRATAPRLAALSASERLLLTEWLDRVLDGGAEMTDTVMPDDR